MQPWIEITLTLLLIAFVGGAVGLSAILIKANSDDGWRVILGSILQGSTTALLSGVVIVLVFPDRRHDSIFVAGLSAGLAHLGVPALRHFALALIRSKLPDDVKKELSIIENSIDLQRLFDTGTHSRDEIEQAIAEFRAKREKEKHDEKTETGETQ